MELLNKRFLPKQKLSSSEMNQITGKIDEIIANVNSSASGTQYVITADIADGEQYLYFIQSDSTAIVTAKASTSVYNSVTNQTNRFVEDYTVKVRIDVGSTGKYVVIENGFTLLSGATYTIDIKKYITSAQSRLKIVIVGNTSGATVTWDGYVQQTTMSLTPSNVEWQKAFVEGSPFNFGSFTITGTLSKEVHVLLSGNGYRQEFIDNIGSRTYASNYYYLNMSFPTTGTGVYKAEIWVSSGTLESKHYSYNIMCVAREDATSARLVCVNEIGTYISNDASCYLFSYALYNCGGTNGNATIIMNASYGNQIHEIYNEEITASTGIKHQLNYFIGISSDDANIALNVNASNGNTFEHTFVIDNSSSFPSTSGAKFLMNPSTRSNSQSNRKIIINDASSVVNSTVSATWTRVSFTDGMDGWTLDDNGRSCLAINAGSKVVINRKMLSDIGNGKTIEFNYKVKNVSDYSENVITVAENENSSRFVGLRIRPDEICLHSKNLNTDDSKQSYHVQDEKEVNCVIVLAKNYRINYGNFAQIYVNGVIKCEFAFSDNDSFATNANIILGSDTADLFVYSIREYDTAFAHTDSHTNYVSSLPTREDKQNAVARDQSVVDDNGDIDFEKVKACANYFVMEMTGDKTDAPNYQTWTKKDVGYSNIEMHWYGHPEWDWIILGVETMGQGTTSMNYFRWNLRWRIDKTNKDKTCYIRYWNTTSNSWGAAALSKTVKFDGDNHTPIMRITAKKNYASSQQSHKMGTTAAYNDLHDVVVGENEAGGRTAVWQAPAYGFLKRTDEVTGQPIYEFIGLFTIGADKGDKPTFAYDNKTYKSTLVTMEGVDHDKPVTMFKYPWSKLTYHGENLCIPKADGTYDNGFEVGNFCGLETAGTATDDAAVMDKMQTEFKDAYEVAYRNSPFIMGVDKSISEINSEVSTFRQGTNEADDFRPIQHYELYDSNYDLYHYDISSNRYEPTGVNVKADLGIADSELVGKTLYQKDLYFREKRRDRFKANVGEYWDLEDTLFCFTFLIIFAATDNNGKNSYPYKFANKYRWRQDDLDTIFSTDNQGHDAKKYSVEFKDFTDDTHSAYAFKGEDSAFWTLIYECYPTEIRQMGYRILDGMVQLSSVKSGTTMQRLMGFFNDYYWSRAQNYFTKSAYNNDAKYSYEDAYPYYPSPYNPGVDPLEQSHGDSLESEMYWVERRLIYCMSQYRYGAFSGYTDTSLGRIAFRTQLAQSFKLRPAMDLYPCILAGQGGAFYGGRTFDGTECEIINAGGSNTDVYIMAADYLRSIGDLCKLAVDATTNSGLTISSKRLEELKVGDVNPSEVTTNLSQLILDNCPSLLTIDARNLTRLTGELNLKNCQRVREVYLGGTDIRSVLFADGCKIQTFQLSDSMTSIILKDLKFLEDLDVRGCATSVNTISISGCDSINAFDVLYNVWATPNNDLTYIRITDVDVNGGQEIAEMLYSIALGKNCDGDSKTYHGVNESGQQTSGAPYISGTIRFKQLMSGYAQAIQEYFQYLTIEVDETIVPSASEIGLALDGEAIETLYENNLPSSRRFTLTANSEIYKQVTWTTNLPTGVTFASDANGCTINLSRFGMDESNVKSQKTITIVATSKWNNAVSVRRTIYIGAVPLLGITISADNDTMDFGSRNAQLTKVLNPTNTTKGGFVYYEYDHDKLNVSASGVVTAATGDYVIAELMAKFRLDDGIVSNILKFYLNDLLLINSDIYSAFADLLSYIYTTLKVSASPTMLYAKEASKVTTLNNKLKGKTDLVNFDSFQYFTSVKILGNFEFQSCTNLSSIKLPDSLTTLYGYTFSGTSIEEIIGNNIESMNQSNFENCKKLKRVHFPKVHLATNDWTANFRYCTSLESVVLGSEISFSVNQLFAGCTSLTYVSPIKLTGNCTFMFSNCTNLSSVDGIDFFETTDGGGMFYNCTSLDVNFSIRFPNAVSTQNMFYGCYMPKDLGDVYLPNAERIDFMFAKTNSIKSVGNIYAPKCKFSHGLFVLNNGYQDTSIKSIGNVTLGLTTWYYHSAFYRLKNLESVGVVDLSACTITEVNSLFESCEKLKTISGLILPNGIINTSNMFYNCSSITDWSFLEGLDFRGVTNISSMFRGCTGMIKLPKAIANWNPDADATTALPNIDGTAWVFNNWEIIRNDRTTLQSAGVTLPFSNMSFVGLPKARKIWTLQGANATKGPVVDLGQNVTEIGWNLVYKLTVVVRALTPPNAVLNNTQNKKVYVYQSVIDDYKSSSQWSNLASQIYPIGGTEWTEEFGSSFEYADYIKYMGELPDLNAGKSANDYMEFLDPEVERICVENWGSGGHITMAQAAAVHSIPDNTFKENLKITSFMELKYFGGEQGFELYDPFQKCYNLYMIDVSNALYLCNYFLNMDNGGNSQFIGYDPQIAIIKFGTKLRGRVSVGSTAAIENNMLYANKIYYNLKHVIIPEGGTYETRSGDGYCRGAQFLKVFDFPSNFSSIGYWNFEKINNSIGYSPSLILRQNTVPQSRAFYKNLKYIFVKPSIINDYKSASGWTDLSDYIKPIGGTEWVAEMQSIAADEGKTFASDYDWTDEYVDYDIYNVQRPNV